MKTPAPISLLILGDISPFGGARALFARGDPRGLFGSLFERIQGADIAIANLEFVLSESAPPSEKIGPVLKGKASDAVLLAEAGFDLLGCANNHIKDCGAEGVLQTLDACEAAGLRTTGAGRNAAEAAVPAQIRVAGWSIGVMAVAEEEFNAAGADEAGAHIFDPLEDLERLRDLKSKCDYVVVLYSGGIEYHPYPSPLLQRTCRSLVRNGADLVLCQHSHVIGTFESYEGGCILYGQGNAVFGYREGKATWNEGLAVAVDLEHADARKATVTLLPIRCDHESRVDLMSPVQAEACLAALAERSERCKDPEWVREAWAGFCRALAPQQIPYLLGFGRLMRRANRLLGGRLVKRLFTRRQRLTTLNVVRCDAHREVVLTSIDQSLARHDHA